MITIKLNYTGSSVTLPVLAIKGMDDKEYYTLFPAIKNVYLDGSSETQYKGYRRRVKIDCGVVESRADRLKILSWYLDNARTIDYGSESGIHFVPNNPEGFENEWINNFSPGRRYVFEIETEEIATQAT